MDMKEEIEREVRTKAIIGKFKEDMKELYPEQPVKVKSYNKERLKHFFYGFVIGFGFTFLLLVWLGIILRIQL